MVSLISANCRKIDEKLSSANVKLNSILAECAEEFGLVHLEEYVLPDECFELLIKVLSEKRFRKCGAISIWLVDLVVDKEKFSKVQKRKLFETLLKNHRGFQRQIARHAVGDIIARLYGAEDAIAGIKLLLKMGDPRSDYVAQVAAEIILAHLRPDHPFQSEVESLFHSK